MADHPKDLDGVIWITVPLDGRTAARLRNFSDAIHETPTDVAASLLHDILADDAEAHRHVSVDGGSLH